jgi:hypothetical protein
MKHCVFVISVFLHHDPCNQKCVWESSECVCILLFHGLIILNHSTDICISHYRTHGTFVHLLSLKIKYNSATWNEEHLNKLFANLDGELSKSFEPFLV